MFPASRLFLALAATRHDGRGRNGPAGTGMFLRRASSTSRRCSTKPCKVTPSLTSCFSPCSLVWFRARVFHHACFKVLVTQAEPPVLTQWLHTLESSSIYPSVRLPDRKIDLLPLVSSASGRPDPHHRPAGHRHHHRRGGGAHPGACGGQPDDQTGPTPLCGEHPLRSDRGESWSGVPLHPDY